MHYKRGRYSWLLRPVLIVYDLFVINFLAIYLFNFNNENLYFFSIELFNNKHVLYIVYAILIWLPLAFLLKFYEVYRFTTILNILSLLAKQFLAFLLCVFAFIGFFRSINIQAFTVIEYLFYSLIAIGAIKVLSFYALKKVRLYLKGNMRNVIIVGSGTAVEELKRIFTNNKELGYNLKAVFSDYDNNVIGTIKDSFKYLNNNNIDEVYCDIDGIEPGEINEFVKHATKNHYNIKFVPNTLKFFNKYFEVDYYNYLPVLSIPNVALNSEFNKLVKRGFDILFSTLIIIFILSWLSVILFIILKLESKGPLFYKHQRNGINYKEFECYKYRSLKTTKEVKGTYVKPNDSRLTKVGKFLRKTNIDELPQFINVFFGDMSIVGPRPHMVSYTDDYSKKIDKYSFILRHHVKPGITGLAQTKGYRGEIKSDADIVNRIKYDIFYIENWSLLLDIKIIFQTTINIIKGEEKAY
ncbi:exopolysaccharide biosynthesis polyprenyl glycosylphosphotransferase [Jejuia spongiicola]|uniref:Exopolysaccharide biosynthesis polyprenyl glycosylphosphotransferase n=1 Tax=Jejuia spongiicola TaxID=2942207 RepID=A0ABT0Q924_9FLAO|nr:exopolysaccharide biosynthesis polyprenyl glycosylphosphotransferase [Jejuia spongiicola]MCL6293409.1 exopolysaccharide biosynthesis polyprenyl glycosylphosphotransferase [Jejuia spongiicola]